MESGALGIVREIVGTIPPELAIVALGLSTYFIARWLRDECRKGIKALAKELDERHGRLAEDLRPKIHDAVTRVDTVMSEQRHLTERVSKLEHEWRVIVADLGDLTKEIRGTYDRIERRLEHGLVVMGKLDRKLAVATSRLNRIEFPRGVYVPAPPDLDDSEDGDG